MSKENGEMEDLIEHAHGLLRRAEDIIDQTENMDPLVSAACSIAAALIALAERRPIEAELCESKPRFVPVGDSLPFDVNRIKGFEKRVQDGHLRLSIGITDAPDVLLLDDDALTFLSWFDQAADVVRLDGAD